MAGLVKESSSDARPAPIVELCRLSYPMSVHDQISRTLRYVANPREYLVEALGQEEFDLRKDDMAISQIFDKDIYGNGTQKSSFETAIARLLGKQHGIFFSSGVQAQLSALKIHCDRRGRNITAWTVNAHLENAEERSFEQLFGLRRILIGDGGKTLPKLQHIASIINLPLAERPAAVLLEVPDRTLGCVTYSYDELAEISQVCRDHDVALHLDGARLWEIMPYYEKTANKSFADICALFDTVYVSMYKGLGGVSGAVLCLGSLEDLGLAKMWQRRAGGNLVTMMYETADCERAFNESVGTFEQRWNKMLHVVSRIQEATNRYFNQDGERIVDFMPRQPTCCIVRSVLRGFSADRLRAARDAVQDDSGIRLFNFLWPSITLDEKLSRDRAVQLKAEPNIDAQPEGMRHEIEWTITGGHEQVDAEVFVKGYDLFCQNLLGLKE